MKNWFVASHGYIEGEYAKGEANAAPTTVPSDLEVIFFCPANRQLGMRMGWKLWDMLMYGQYGGEDVAYNLCNNKVAAHAPASNYCAVYTQVDHHDWNDGDHRLAGRPAKYTLGIWEVGNPNKPVIDLRTDLSTIPFKQHQRLMPLSTILEKAALAGVSRVYWGPAVRI
ncbi:MAG: hypothetical protein RNU03_17415 [Candidatus Sedimenticola sp. (ex Thyasira tokunagai)]